MKEKWRNYSLSKKIIISIVGVLFLLFIIGSLGGDADDSNKNTTNNTTKEENVDTEQPKIEEQPKVEEESNTEKETTNKTSFNSLESVIMTTLNNSYPSTDYDTAISSDEMSSLCSIAIVSKDPNVDLSVLSSSQLESMVAEHNLEGIYSDLARSISGLYAAAGYNDIQVIIGVYDAYGNIMVMVDNND